MPLDFLRVFCAYVIQLSSAEGEEEKGKTELTNTRVARWMRRHSERQKRAEKNDDEEEEEEKSESERRRRRKK